MSIYQIPIYFSLVNLTNWFNFNSKGLQLNFTVFVTLLDTSPPHLNNAIYPKANTMMPQVNDVQFCNKQFFSI